MIKIENLNNINKDDMDNILNVWESSVRATHTFLKEEDIISIKPQVKEGVDYVSKLLCVRDEKGVIQAFMGVHQSKIEMLFVDSNNRGNGIGKKLIDYAINVLNAKFVDVNEQNTQGVGFYKYMGFDTFKRSEFDDHENPFPILHMKFL
ncbi:GNAT family acetyltransferase [Clostridium sporogenes]|uniref:GNAT family N-acetyltransferase n=1 Tax=Clostridium botulinum TaxID=1491 RepID=UPI000717AA00|nr:GNAT family N-acetyltransferase [Clostridium botulinum]KRU28228.1 GNAT family acetyltransferase [Clostridium sporogenes]KRU31026.1 GNAT family acetyltransferase [Clostridium sporogenes]KRU34417.1 GNAT family acetyltransferase [Clostridium sporogenes]KRU47272.1 GNAT family acetyltransferase [Clostridium sporogenes]MBZ1330919.1 GNAT family N-acetyltransferase [Clostridium botulinum]